ncbi:MAG: methyltransferase domain-containing protein [Candidatus Angelobacter sp.]
MSLYSEPQGYGAGVFEHTAETEGERLSLIEEEQDPYTTARIEALGIAEDWHCLEIGAGKGSMAYWLADRCPRGRIVATDLDTSLLSVSGRPTLEVLQHDVAKDEFPPESFHLIHARAVLTHALEPEQACVRMSRWLRPGGWLLITDPASFTVDSSPHSLMRKAGAASTAVMREMVGTDPNWARTYPAPLVAAGLVEVDAECRLRMMQGGTREAIMFELMLAQLGPHMVATGLITAEEVKSLRAQLLDPAFFDFPPAVIRAWGRRPL